MNSSAPKILAITSELPWPLNTGGHLRTFHMMTSLARYCDITLVTGVKTGSAPHTAPLEEHGIHVVPARIASNATWRNIPKIIGAGLSGVPYVMFYRHHHVAFRNVIRAQLSKQAFDIVYFDHLDPFVYASLLPRQQKIVCDLHNVYSRLAARVASEHRGPLNIYLSREARLLERAERQVAAAADLLFAVSEDEGDIFRQYGGKKVCVVPNGVDCSAYAHLPVGRSQQPPTLLYVGALSWQPNVAAATFLATEVLPQVRESIPQAVLKLVGRSPSAEVLSLAGLPGVEIHGDVPSITEYLASASLLAVALDSGGGTRLKILEAFAAGLPVVSTPVGCEGIECTHEHDLIIADRPAFAAAVVELLNNPAKADKCAENARALATGKYDWRAIGERAHAAITSIL